MKLIYIGNCMVLGEIVKLAHVPYIISDENTRTCFISMMLQKVEHQK